MVATLVLGIVPEPVLNLANHAALSCSSASHAARGTASRDVTSGRTCQRPGRQAGVWYVTRNGHTRKFEAFARAD